MANLLLPGYLSFRFSVVAAGTDGIFRGLHRPYFNSMLSVLLPMLLESNCTAAATAAPGAGAATPSTAAEQLHQQQQQQEQQSAALSISGAFEALPLSGTMRHIAMTAVKNSPTPNVLSAHFCMCCSFAAFPFSPFSRCGHFWDLYLPLFADVLTFFPFHLLPSVLLAPSGWLALLFAALVCVPSPAFFFRVFTPFL